MFQHQANQSFDMHVSRAEIVQGKTSKHTRLHWNIEIANWRTCHTPLSSEWSQDKDTHRHSHTIPARGGEKTQDAHRHNMEGVKTLIRTSERSHKCVCWSHQAFPQGESDQHLPIQLPPPGVGHLSWTHPYVRNPWCLRCYRTGQGHPQWT